MNTQLIENDTEGNNDITSLSNKVIILEALEYQLYFDPFLGEDYKTRIVDLISSLDKSI